MGKHKKSFVKGRGEKRKKNFSGKFKKKRKLNDGSKNDKTNIYRKRHSNEYTPKPVVDKVERFVNEESEDEDPFSQLVNSFGGNNNLKYASSSDSESDSEQNGNNQSVPEETQNELSSEDDNFLVEEDLEKDSLTDPFEIHFQRDLNDHFYNILSSLSTEASCIEETALDFPTLGKCIFTRYNFVDASKNKLKINLSCDNEKLDAVPGKQPDIIKHVNWNNLCVKTQIQENINKANIVNLNAKNESPDKLLTPLQKELFSVVNNYQDLYYPERTFDNSEEVRLVYCLHAINHALKTRLKVVHHNSRLSDKSEVPEEFRDQGLVRPKVLIVLPFRESALRTIKIMISILLASDDNANVVNKKRFLNEFTGGEIAMPRKNPKPVDYETMFKGNADDNFRIGISVTKKSLKLYADFYSSDIIVASPLGLRLIIGAEGEPERDFDFLASIEVLVLDQTDVFLMQNWDHLLHLFEHLHCQPQKSHGTDFSRVRNWALNGWTRYYRQTIMLSSAPLPLVTALFVKKCNNYAGKLTVSNPILFGTICQVAIKVPQVFCRVDCTSSLASVDTRFTYFINEILPQMRDPFMNHTMIYVPSYFDFVMLRNYFKKETISFVQICEYSKDGKIARARDMFFHGESHFLLYSERFHFFRRIRVKGIRHIVFYQPPSFAHFYNELCNIMQDDKDTNVSVTTLYTKYDIAQLSGVVGTERATRILKANNSVYRIVAE